MNALAVQINRIKTRTLGAAAPYIRDPRPAQKTKKAIQPSAEQVAATSKSFGIDSSKRSAKKEILVHSCFNQRHGENKSRHCTCDTYIEFWQARNLIEKGDADFLTYIRVGKEQQDRKRIVLTAEYLQRQAHSHDALNHKLPLSLTGFIDSTTGYNMAPITSEAVSGLDKEINNVRRGAIAKRKREIEANRKHRVSPKGNAIDSDSSRDDMANGQGVGQMSSCPDRAYRSLGNQNPNANPKAPKNSIQERLEKSRNLPRDARAVVSEEAQGEFLKERKDAETTILTGVE